MSIRIGIAGMAGRMGQLLIEEVSAAGAVCVGGTLRAGGKAAPSGLQSFPDIASLFAASDVVIDFTHADTAPAHAAAAAACGKGFILGSSGLSAAAEAAVAEAGKRAPIVYAANFAPGVNLFLAIAERGTTMEEAGIESGRDGHCGPRGTGTIGFAALRGGQVVGEHTLLFAAASEHISLTHRSFDRRVYATGAVRAALWVHGRAPALYGMKNVLGM
jgi:4-hydroxy-tetrahydrodipicolinate reductase